MIWDGSTLSLCKNMGNEYERFYINVRNYRPLSIIRTIYILPYLREQVASIPTHTL
jgi:hypothetical protein